MAVAERGGMQASGKKQTQRPPQTQERQPGLEHEMTPPPKAAPIAPAKQGKLTDKVALITGGDSGIGRAVALAFAAEGADVAIAYLDEHEDARETERLVAETGRRCRSFAGDVGEEAFCRRLVEDTVKEFGHLDILVNNAAEQHERERLEDITEEQLVRTFRTNIFSMFFLAGAALPVMQNGAAIINTTSVTAYRGSGKLIDYSATKGAIVAFTRSLAQSLVKRGIRVNGVAPGPVWTPLIPASFDAKRTAEFGSDQPMGRAAEPAEIAPCYVFLAAADSRYMTGQVLHPNGGEIVNG
jgi:NAD(P)-dependent dehydrogenase (short-subunit alcohol dehydrogenase family)